MQTRRSIGFHIGLYFMNVAAWTAWSLIVMPRSQMHSIKQPHPEAAIAKRLFTIMRM
jgi:hypothetical protein